MENASIDSRPHYRFDAFSTVHTLWRKLNSMRMPQTGAPAIFYNPPDTYDVIFFILILSRPFSTVHTNTIWTRFRFDPLSRAFSNWCASDENAQRISVDRRPKRIEMYAF